MKTEAMSHQPWCPDLIPWRNDLWEGPDHEARPVVATLATVLKGAVRDGSRDDLADTLAGSPGLSVYCALSALGVG